MCIACASAVIPFPFQWQEAEAAYKNAVAVCNSCQYQVHKSAQVHCCVHVRTMHIHGYKFSVHLVRRYIFLNCCIVLPA